MSHIKSLDVTDSDVLRDESNLISVKIESSAAHEQKAAVFKIGWGGARANSGPKPKTITAPLALGVRWYVAETHPQAERWVAQDLARAGWTAYLPLTVVFRRDRVTPTMTHREVVPLMPGFVFVQFDRDERTWGTIIAGCKGIRSILGSVMGRPSPVSVAEIRWLRDEAQGGEEARLQFKAARPGDARVVGTAVVVAGVPGLVASCDGLTTVVDVAMFGRTVQVALPWGQVNGGI